MDISVFYAWQSDRPKECNHDLIRDAAQAACDRITNDPANDLVIHLDQDTAGTPGMCDIPNTILEKIRDCDVFLADLTFVGRTDAEVKRAKVVSNPNVLLELGYAVGTKAGEETDGFERVIGVMNVAFGKPEDQMFDIRHRPHISYELPQGNDKASVDLARESLSREIENALLTILGESVVPVKGEAGSERFQQIRDQFESSVREGSFHGLFLNNNVIAVTLAPDRPQNINHAKLREQNLLAPGRVSSRPETRGRSVIASWEVDAPRSEGGSKVRCSVAEVNVEGTILAADTFCLHSRFHPRDEVGGDDIVPSIAFERELIECVEHYGAILTALEVPLPWRLGISFLGIRGYYLYAGPLGPHRTYEDDDLITDPVVIRSAEDVSGRQQVARLLKDTLDYIWREFGLCGSANYDEDGNWKPR